MNKNLRWLALGATLFGMGFTMPGCPDMKAVNSSIDAVKTSVDAEKSKISALETQVKVLRTDVDGIKSVTTNQTNTIQQMMTALTTMEADIKQLKESLAASAKKGSSKSRRH